MPNHPYQKERYRKTALRIIKKEPAIVGMPNFVFDADFEISLEPELCYETENEFVIYTKHFLLKDACLISGYFHTGGDFEVSDIVLEGKRLYFQEKDHNIWFNFEISGLVGSTRTLYIHTLLRQPGLTLRIEQNDPGRRIGNYRKEAYPEHEILAASHYMFAMREIVNMLGIPKYLNTNKLGYLLILGFETNNKMHTDYPPHWHFIFRWPYFCGSQAPHIYLDKAGKMTHNLCSIDGIGGAQSQYGPGEWCRLVDMYGNDVMAIRVDDQGGLSATKPNGQIFTMHPFSPEKGVIISKEDKIIGSIHLENDTKKGNLSLVWDSKSVKDSLSYCEKVTYDVLTGDIKEIKHED